MSLHEELRDLENRDDAYDILGKVAQCGTISVTGNYESYDHLLERDGYQGTEHEVGSVIAHMPSTIREFLVISYGEGPDGLSSRELNLVTTGVRMAVLALELYARSTDPSDATCDD